MAFSWFCGGFHKTRDMPKQPEEASPMWRFAIGQLLRYFIQTLLRDTFYRRSGVPFNDGYTMFFNRLNSFVAYSALSPKHYLTVYMYELRLRTTPVLA
jgi:hypothetical protein